ncbi:MAG: hypothetical protein H7Y07_07050 [Pyrinomonadaceae bacterium]|nr:hypothetical protein [Sphingobacteriaceae bacterium]
MSCPRGCRSDGSDSMITYGASQGIALIMGTALGALIPLLYGRLADLINTQQAYWIMVPCYLLIGHFSTYGYKI